MGRVKDTFKILYAEDCEKTQENDFFTKNDKFKCWISNAGSEENLYLAIYPMFENDKSERARVLRKIIARLKPICNMEDKP